MEPTLEAQFDDNRTLTSTLHYLVETEANGHIRLELPDGRWGDIYLDNGRVTHIDSSGGQTVADLANLTTQAEGTFRFYRGVPAPKQTLRVLLTSLLPADEILEDDTEATASKTIHLTGESVLVANQNPTLHANTTSINHLGVQMLLHLNGKRPLAVIAQLIQQPLDTIIRIAQDLSDIKMLQLVGTRLSISPRFFSDLRTMATPYFGPIVEFLIDDCVEDLGYDTDNFPPEKVRSLFTLLRQKLQRDDWQHAFKKDFYLLCKQYKISLKKP